MDLKNFYKHINICLNAVTRLREDLLPDYHLIKGQYEFEKYFIPNNYHRSYYWNSQTYTPLGNSLFVSLTNDTCVKYSMAPQSCKVVNTHAHEISVWKIYLDFYMSMSLILEGCKVIFSLT